MGDDIGWMQPSIYHQGLMVGETPNIDRIGKEGARFMTYYAEQSCTAGRNAFFTGMHPLRTGMIPPQLPGSPSWLRPGTPSLAKFLLDLGYNTGEFGKNHLGDHFEALPTSHGFQEYWGYLYHLDAMEDPAHPNYPQDLLDKVGPRNMVHSWATAADDPTQMPRWGKVGKQRIEDAGTLYPERMKTVGDEIRDKALAFIEKAKADGKPFFVWKWASWP